MDIKREMQDRGWTWHELAVLISLKGVPMTETRLRRLAKGLIKGVGDDVVKAIAAALRKDASEVREWIENAAHQTRVKMAREAESI